MIYFISKLLPLLLLPLGFGLIFILIGLIRGKRVFVILGTAIIYTFSLGFVTEGIWRFVEKPWIRKNTDDATKADAIVVLSGSRHPSPGDSKIAEWRDPDRFLVGIELFKKNKAPKLFFTGGKNLFQPNMPGEGSYYVKEAIELGIPSEAVKTSSDALNTSQEAVEIRRMLESYDKRKSKSILLVTSAFHMKRAKTLFERNGITVNPFPVDFQGRGKWAGSIWQDPLIWIPTANSLSSSSRALRELLGRLYYRSF